MHTVHDAAAHIVDHFDHPITTMKMQKLAYFAQGWAYDLLGRHMFAEDFQAWRNGPVCSELFQKHRGKYMLSSWPHGSSANLPEEEKIVLDAVLRNFGALSGEQLSEFTHEPGTPWDRVRQEQRVPSGKPTAAVIPKSYIEDWFTQR